MALGTLTVVSDTKAQGPVRFIKATLVGDGAYSTGGSTGLLAKLQAALSQNGLAILDVRDAYAATTTRATHVVYDVANDKLIARTTSTGAEFTTGDQSGTTHTLWIVAA